MLLRTCSLLALLLFISEIDLKALENSVDSSVAPTRNRRQVSNNISCVSEDDLWKCNDCGEIKCSDRCNGRADCKDRSDETAITCRNVFCADDQFRCSYGGCVPETAECNTENDCADGSDERTLNCPGVINSFRRGGSCGEGLFQCKSGGCIHEDEVCNGYANCPDRSDETYALCSSHFCPALTFKCDYGACIAAVFKCDGGNDCADGSDEKESECRPPPVLEGSVRTLGEPSGGTNEPSRPSGSSGGGSGRGVYKEFNLQSGPAAPFAEPNYGFNYEEYQRLQKNHIGLQIQMYENSINILKLYQNVNAPVNFAQSGPTSPQGATAGFGPNQDPRALTSFASARSNDFSPAPTLFGGASTNQLPLMSSSFGRSNIPDLSRQSSSGSCQIRDIEGGWVLDSNNEEFRSEFAVNGAKLHFECFNGAVLIGSNVTYCVNGEFINLFPFCQRQCSTLSLNTLSVQATCHRINGETIPCTSFVPPKTIAVISCKVGYKKPERVVKDAITCLEDGSWDTHVYKCIQVCGTISDGAGYVVGGRQTNITKIPWHVAIYSETRDKRMEQICGGSIINPTAIVTAAHCFWDGSLQRKNDPKKYVVAVGKTLRDFYANEASTQVLQVKEIDIYDQYLDYEGLYVSDIAVVVLETPIIFYSHIKPICIEYNLKNNERYIPSGIEGRVAGWGLTTSGGKPSPILKVIDLPTVDYNTCVQKSPPEFKQFITSDKFCAGFTTGQSVCTGDSGGGLAFSRTFADNSTAFYLRGIVSNGPRLYGSCDNRKYTAFTDVQLNIFFLYKYIADS